VVRADWHDVTGELTGQTRLTLTVEVPAVLSYLILSHLISSYLTQMGVVDT